MGRWTLVCLMVAGCHLNTTERGRYSMELSPEYGVGPFASGAKVLVDTRLCIGVESYRDDGVDVISSGDPPWFEECLQVAPDGALTRDGDCYVLDTVGEVVFAVEPIAPCSPWQRSELQRDVFRVDVVPPNGVRARFEWPYDVFALRRLHDVDGSPLPPDLVPPADEPVRIADGGQWFFGSVLEDAAGDRVAYDRAQAVIEFTVIEGDPVLEEDDDGDVGAATLRTGDVLDATLTLPTTGQLPLGRMIGVDPAEARSIEVVAAYGEAQQLVAVRAVVRDASQRMIVSAPIEWTVVEGPLVLDEEATMADYASASDSCLPEPKEPERRRATIRADLFDLHDELEVEWTSTPDPIDDDRDEEFEPDPRCPSSADAVVPRGCGCRAGESAGWLWILALGCALVRTRGPSRSRWAPTSAAHRELSPTARAGARSSRPSAAPASSARAPADRSP